VCQSNCVYQSCCIKYFAHNSIGPRAPMRSNNFAMTNNTPRFLLSESSTYVYYPKASVLGSQWRPRTFNDCSSLDSKEGQLARSSGGIQSKILRLLLHHFFRLQAANRSRLIVWLCSWLNSATVFRLPQYRRRRYNQSVMSGHSLPRFSFWLSAVVVERIGSTWPWPSI